MPWEIWLFLSGVVGIGCAVVISGVRLRMLGVVLIGMFCFTASWDDVLLGLGQHPAAVPGARAGCCSSRRSTRCICPRSRGGSTRTGLAAVVATGFQLLFPVSQAYLDTRYATSASGQSLGERAGTLPSLASLLFNNYARAGRHRPRLHGHAARH